MAEIQDERKTLEKPKYRCSVKLINPSRLDARRRGKINLIFIFTLICGASKGFMKAIKTLIKPFEEPQRSV